MYWLPRAKKHKRPVVKFDILSEAFFRDPYPTLAMMRSDAPCWYDARLHAHVITRFDDITHVLKSPMFSSERVTQFGRGAPEDLRDKLQVYTEELERWLLFSDAPVHAPLRKQLAQIFGTRLRRPIIERSVGAAIVKVLAELQEIKEPDLVRDFAYPVPTIVLANVLGIPSEDIELFKRWTDDIFALIGAGIADRTAVESGYRGVTELRAYVVNLIGDRWANPREDVLSDLAELQAGSADAGMSADYVVGLLMTMVVAGHETTTNLIGNGLYGILSDRGARSWVLAHNGISDTAVDELIRFDGSVFSLIRRARRDVFLAGTLVREGEYVFNMLNAGNRDPKQFEDPDRLNLDRPRSEHLGLGVGMHACLGAAMARTVVSQAVSEFLRAWPQANVGPECSWRRNMSIRGPLKLPVQLGRPYGRSRRFAGELSARLESLTLRADAELGAEPLADLAENRARNVAAIIYAADTDVVRRVVLEANARAVPIYPVSTGKNWGLGSRTPVTDGCILLDLGDMNRVRKLDLERGIALVEPGVTQGMLADRLEGTPFLLNVTTSCRDSSVLGNILDRGQGVLRLRTDELLGLEVVLGNGTVISTGGIGPADERQYFGGGTGPDATRLFCQSNFGVVTAAAIALVPRPERAMYCYASFAGEALPSVIDCVARLRREQLIDHIFHLGEMQIDPGGTSPPGFTLLGPLCSAARAWSTRRSL